MSFEIFEATIVSPALKAVARHWNQARGARKMPAWSDIKPSAIAAHLPIVWAYKYDRATDTFTGRLAGDRITSIFGAANIRGLAMSEGFPADQYPVLFARSKRIITQPALMRGSGLAFRHLDRYGTGERIMMPLAEDGEHGDGIFGATEYHLNYTTDQDLVGATEVEEWFALD